MNLSKLLPYENFNFTTKLSTTEVMDRLSKNVSPKSTNVFSFNRDMSKPYTGKIYTNTFEISRVINYKNSFLPNINGTLTSFLGKTEVEIKMKPFTAVIVFMAIWLGFVGIACIGILIYIFMNLSNFSFSFGIIIPFIMFIFGCLLCTIPFKMEAKKSKEFLFKLFEAQII